MHISMIWRTCPDRRATPRAMIRSPYIVINACAGQLPLQAPTRRIFDFRTSATCVMNRICNARINKNSRDDD